MKRVRYTKFTGDLSSSIDLEDLLQALSDFLLDSGFNDPWSSFSELNEQTMENLREAIRQALESGDLFNEEMQEKFDQLSGEQNYINAEQPEQGPGELGNGNENVRFEVTDKAMDFLGYKALRELLGTLGR